MILCIIPAPMPDAGDLAALRRLCALGIAEIRAAAVAGTPIREVPVFGSGWDTERLLLRDLVCRLLAGDAAFVIGEKHADGVIVLLEPAAFVARLAHARAIELEQQMCSDLECGHIASPDDFSPHDDDWLAPCRCDAAGAAAAQ